jgi:hypothetical protein
MIKSITNNQQSLLRGVTAGLFALMLAVFAMPAQAQMDDGELPKIDWSVNLMQSAQYISLSTDNTDPIAGFHRVRAGIGASVQFAEGVSGVLLVEQEPNDFGGQFAPAVDFAVLNVQASDALTIQAGTPVTGLLNFRGFSDGPVTQSNPLIGNSPADMITAGQGVKLIGSYDTFGFDLTINKGFAGTLTSAAGGNTGVNVIGKFRYTGSDLFKVGAGVATATGSQGVVFAGGDGENYALSSGVASAPVGYSGGGINAIRNTHANIPGGGFITQADGKITNGPLSADLWVGYASDGDTDQSSLFGGLGAKFDVNDSFYLAARGTAVSDQSDGADNLDSSTLFRLQGGVGYYLADSALLKVEGVSQSHGEGYPGGVGQTRPANADSFFGVLTELSFNF